MYARDYVPFLLTRRYVRTYVYFRTHIRTVRTQVDNDFQGWRSKQPVRVEVLEDIVKKLYARNPRLGLRPAVRVNPWA